MTDTPASKMNMKEPLRQLGVLINAINPHLRKGDLAGTEARCKELEAFLTGFEGKSAQPENAHFFSIGYSDLASAYRIIKNVPQAEAFYAKTIGLLQTIIGVENYAQFASNTLAACHNQLGLLYMDCGPQDKAVAALEQAIALRRKLTGTYPQDLDNLVYLGGALCNRGHIAADQKEIAAARQFYDEAIAIFDRVSPQHDAACQAMQEAMTSALAAAGRAPGWLRVVQQFRVNAENGRRSLPA